MNNNRAFTEGEPSLFIIQTPFQAMCAINAIRQLKIENYELSLHLHKNTGKRNKQTIELVEKCGLEYKVAKTKPISLIMLIGLFFKRNKRYNRVFLGTHLYHDGYYYALKELKKGGNLVLLDDGVATLTLLKGQYKVTGGSAFFLFFYKMVSNWLRIDSNNIFTVYKGVESPNWNVEINDISLLRTFEYDEEDNYVFIIGTNNSGYIERRGVDETSFKKTIFKVLNEIKKTYPNEKIIYIPHGRDKSLFAKDYCDSLGIVYKSLDVNVENYLLTAQVFPHVVFGFTSTALYNIKMIFPQASVHNIVLKVSADKSPSILEVSKYYEKQGISYEIV